MSVRSLSLVVVSVLAASLCGASSAAAAPGDLDQTFGNGGIATATLTGRLLIPLATTTQPDGKVVIAGFSSGNIGTNYFRQFVARVNADGSPDLSFGTGGFTETEYAETSTVNELATDVAVAPDGHIVTSGVVGAGGNQNSTVSSYLANGAPDPAFGPALDGKRLIAFGDVDTENSAQKVAVTDDGKILLLGTAYRTSDHDTYVAKLSSTGVLDSGFGIGGTRYLHYIAGGIASNDRAADFAKLSDGKLLVYSICETSTDSCLALTRLTDVGGRDSTFGVDGDFKFVPDHDVRPRGIVVQSTGRIVLTGLDEPFGTRALAMYRVLSDGSSLDGTFGTGGFARIAYPGEELVIASTAPAGGDGILASGRVNASESAVLVRANADGTASSAFGSNGIKVFTQLPNTTFQDVTVSATGRYVAPGTQPISQTSPIVRLIGDGTEPVGPPAPIATSVKIKSPSKSKLKASKLKSISGTAAGTGLRKVQLAIQQIDSKLLKKSKRCRFVTGSSGKTKKYKPVKKKCAPTKYLTAKGTTSWSYKIKLKPGKYKLFLVGVGDVVGKTATKTFTLTK